MGLIFRKAIKGDEGQVLQLINTVLESYGLKLNIKVEDLDVTDLEKYYLNNNGDFEVVINNGLIIGSYGIYKINKDTCELRKMYLYEEYQGVGLGNEMLRNSLAMAKKLGYKKITLQTNSVLDKALKLYEKFGFENYVEDVCDRCDLAMFKSLE